jgi:phosphoadenosine phosphosulfate reductase
MLESLMSQSRYTAEQIAAAAVALEGQTPERVLKWAVDTFYPRLTMATAFGPEGNCIIHMLAEIEPRVRIFNLDTGYQFRETVELRERIKERYSIEVELVRPDQTVVEYEAEHGGPLYDLTSAVTIAKSCPCAGRWWATTPGSAPFAGTRRKSAPRRP